MRGLLAPVAATAAGAALCLTLVVGAQSTTPLPDPSTFLKKTRERLASNELLQSRYAFKERTREQKMNPLGHMGPGSMLVHEVYPSVDPKMTYRRLIERDGQPLTLAEISAQDEEYRRRYLSWQQQLVRETSNAAAARKQRLVEEERRERQQAAEIIALFDFSVDRREMWQDEPAIVIRFKPVPVPHARPSSREARVAVAFAGQAWIHETEHEVMHLEAQTIESVSFGFGMVARLHQGATTSLTRNRTLGVWLPAETRFAGTGRALMLRKVTIDYFREYFDYRPFDPSDPPPIPGLASADSK